MFFLLDYTTAATTTTTDITTFVTVAQPPDGQFFVEKKLFEDFVTFLEVVVQMDTEGTGDGRPECVFFVIVFFCFLFFKIEVVDETSNHDGVFLCCFKRL